MVGYAAHLAVAGAAGAAVIEGHIKRNPDSGEVAIRTIFDIPELAHMAWLIATANSGARYVGDDVVADWTDLFVPEEGS